MELALELGGSNAGPASGVPRTPGAGRALGEPSKVGSPTFHLSAIMSGSDSALYTDNPRDETIAAPVAMSA
jgi:hypothetical protein